MAREITVTVEGAREVAEDFARRHIGEPGEGFGFAGVECAHVCEAGGEAVLVSVRAAVDEGEPGMPELSLGADELDRMRRCCLAYAAESGRAAGEVRLDVVSVLVGRKADGRPAATVRHMIAAAVAE